MFGNRGFRSRGFRNTGLKTSVTAVLLLSLAGAATPPATASSAAAPPTLLGLWRTQEEQGVVEIFRCDDALCGRVVDAASLRADPDQRDIHNSDKALRQRRVKGLVILENFTGGPHKWSGGPLYDPKTGDGARRGYLTLENADRLKVKGCLAVFLCRTQIWTRIDGTQPPAL